MDSLRLPSAQSLDPSDLLPIKLPLLTCSLPVPGLSNEARREIADDVLATHNFIEKGTLTRSEKENCISDLLQKITSDKRNVTWDLYGITERVFQSWGLGELQKFVEPLSSPGTGMIQPLSLIKVATDPQGTHTIHESIRKDARIDDELPIESVTISLGTSFSCVVEWKAHDVSYTTSDIAKEVSKILTDFETKQPRDRVVAIGQLFTYLTTIPGTKPQQSPVRGTERISPENVEAALKLARDIFPDAYDRAEIEHVFTRAAYGGEIDSQRFPDLDGVVLGEQHLFRDENGAPIGFSGLQWKSRNFGTAEISWFGIAPAAQGKGVGSEIMDLTVEDAERKGCNTLEVVADTTRTDTTRFYNKFGFTVDSFVSFGGNKLPHLTKKIFGVAIRPYTALQAYLGQTTEESKVA